MLQQHYYYSRTKSQNLHVSRLVLQSYLPNPLKPGAKSRMEMLVEPALLQQHLSDQKKYCLLRLILVYHPNINIPTPNVDRPPYCLYVYHQGPSIHWELNGVTNTLTAGKFGWNFMYLILQIISVIDGWGISRELALRWMSLDLTDDKSTLVQVMAWCCQATSHYLSQCWPRSMSPYGVIKPQWVNSGKSL